MIFWDIANIFNNTTVKSIWKIAKTFLILKFSFLVLLQRLTANGLLKLALVTTSRTRLKINSLATSAWIYKALYKYVMADTYRTFHEYATYDDTPPLLVSYLHHFWTSAESFWISSFWKFSRLIVNHRTKKLLIKSDSIGIQAADRTISVDSTVQNSVLRIAEISSIGGKWCKNSQKLWKIDFIPVDWRSGRKEYLHFNFDVYVLLMSIAYWHYV